jgi:hypothetical protein
VRAATDAATDACLKGQASAAAAAAAGESACARMGYSNANSNTNSILCVNRRHFSKCCRAGAA